MQALSDEKQMNRLEQKVDGVDGRINGVAAKLETKIDDVGGEARSDFRTLLGVLLAMYATTIVGFAAIFLQHHP